MVSQEKVGVLPFDNATPEQLALALSKALIFPRYNTRNQRQQVWFLGDGKGWEDVTDVTANRIRETVRGIRLDLANESGPIHGMTGCVDVSNARFNDLFGVVCASNAIDPFEDYLRDLPKWDGYPRLGAWLTYCFDVADESLELASWASDYVFLGAVWRTFQPGCKLDEFPVLIGKGGIGKSTGLRYVLPPELRDMFSDGLALGAQSKERAEALQGKLIVEAAEMQGVRRADMESLKAFISRQDDGGIRLAYRRNPEPMPRRCIIVGTADRPDPLPDDPNLRRFVPINLSGGDPVGLMDYMDETRHQLWAEAVWMYHNGHHPRLPDYLKEAQQEATESARAKDTVIEDSLERWLTHNAPETFTTEQAGIGIGLVSLDNSAKLSRIDSNRIGAALRHKGYAQVSTRVDGKVAKRWKRNP